MTPKQILSASLLDIVFDDRNKSYGAYDLRVTYPERIKKSLLFTFALALIVFTGAALANSIKPKKKGALDFMEVTLTNIEPEEKKPEPLPEPERKPDPPQQKTQQFTQFNIVPEDVDPPPTQEDLVTAKIAEFTQDGVVDNDLVVPEKMDEGKKIIEENKNVNNNEPVTIVEMDAKFLGNWTKFLTRNLNADVPVDNGAPAGRYQVIIQFVVDLDGNVSNIKALTSHGYGMEEEAIRAVKKATKWEPAFQNGVHVKAYRKQPITFEVMAE